MLWEGAFYIDSVLPFGLWSAPKIFTAIADAVEWMVRHKGVETLFHYLDEFLIVTQSESCQCQEDLNHLLSVFERLHIPVALDKLEGPTTTLTNLGLVIDTYQMVMRLQERRLQELQVILDCW